MIFKIIFIIIFIIHICVFAIIHTNLKLVSIRIRVILHYHLFHDISEFLCNHKLCFIKGI